KLVSGDVEWQVIGAGKDLFRQRGCFGCHRYEGYDREPEDLLSIAQQIKQIEQEKKENLKQSSYLMKQADTAATNEEANALTDQLPKHKPSSAAHGKELLETRGCLGCHSIGEGDQMEGAHFAANLTRVGEKDNFDYLVRWVHNARERTRPYCPYEKKDIGP